MGCKRVGPWYKIVFYTACCFGTLAIYMYIDIAMEGYGRTPTIAKDTWDAFYGLNAPGRFSYPEVDEQIDFLHKVIFERLNISYSISDGILLASLRHPNSCFPPYSNDVDIVIPHSGAQFLESIAAAGTSHPLNRDGAILLTRDLTPDTFASPTCATVATPKLPLCGTPYPHLKIVVRASAHAYEPFVRNCKGQRVSPVSAEEDMVRVDYQCDRCSWFGGPARVVGPYGSWRPLRTGNIVANNGMYTDIGVFAEANTHFPKTKTITCNGIPARQFADDAYSARILKRDYGADYNEPSCVWWYFTWTCRKYSGMSLVDRMGHSWISKIVLDIYNPVMCYTVLPTVNGYAKAIAVCNFALLFLVSAVCVLCAAYKLVRFTRRTMKNRHAYLSVNGEDTAKQGDCDEESVLGVPHYDEHCLSHDENEKGF